MDWTTSWVSERRLGERYPAASIPVAWRVDERRFRIGPRRTVTAHILDLSALGAGVLAPDAAELEPPATVVIEWDGRRAVVEIRHVEPGPVPRVSLYGVRFGEMSEEFARHLDRTLGEMRPSSVEAQHPA